MKTATAKPKVRSHNAKPGHGSGICMLPGEVLWVCIARAAVNESVCEHSYAEHVQFATAVSKLS